MKARPLLFIHGEKDSYIPFDQTVELFEMARRPKHLWIVPGAKHNQSVVTQPQRYADRTVAFFDRYLAGLPSAAARWLDEPANVTELGRQSPASGRRRRRDRVRAVGKV
jgi:hypothetical protein